MELHSALGVGSEHPVDDAAVIVQVRVEAGAEAVHEAHRPEPGTTTSPGTRLAQGLFDDPQEDAEHRTDPLRVTHEEVAQALRDRQDPYMVRPAMQEGNAVGREG